MMVSRENARRIILNSESDLNKEIVSRYTDSELKEWMRLLGFKANF